MPWSPELQRSEPHSRPFVASFGQHDRQLEFVSAHHGIHQDSDTYRAIAEVLFQPEVKLLIIEGLPESQGQSPKNFLEFSQRHQGKDGIWERGEMTYAVYLADRRGLPFIGGEPDEPQIWRGLIQRGFRPEDILGFYVVRQIPQWRRQKQLEQESEQALVERFLATVCQDFQIESQWGWSDFQGWYANQAGKNYSRQDLKDEEAAPMLNGPYLTQRISAQVSLLRDQHLAQVIEQKLKEYPHLAVIYGGSHLACLRPWLIQHLGQPTREWVP